MHHTPTPPRRHTTLTVLWTIMNAVRRCNFPHWRTELTHAVLRSHTNRKETERICPAVTPRLQHNLKSTVCVGGGEAGGNQEKQGPWTHCETNADSGGEGPWDELALVVLNQQRGLAHSAVSHQDGLQREGHDIM